jgi:hypothetical protein
MATAAAISIPTRLQKLQHEISHHGKNRGGNRHDDSEHREKPGLMARQCQALRSLTACRCGVEEGSPRQRQQIDWKRHAKMERRIPEACAAPSQIRGKDSTDRPAYSARKSAEQRDRSNRAARFLGIDAADGGKCRVRESGAHAATDQQPRGQIPGEILRRSQRDKSASVQDRAEREHQTPAALANRPAKPWRNEASGKKPDRQLIAWP